MSSPAHPSSAEETPPEPKSRRGGDLLRRIFSPTHVSLAAPILMVAFLGWQQRWVSDDGWINIRVLEQFFAGNGPVYNMGERVELTTSTLWFWILLGGHALFPWFESQQVGAIIGLVLTLIGMIAASYGSALLFTGRKVLAFLPLGTLAMAALPPFWDFATSGLETGLAFGWLGVVFAILVRRVIRFDAGIRHPACWPIWPAILIGLGPLIRPDFALYSLTFAVALLLSSRFGILGWLGCFLLATAIPGVYQIFRMGYFAVMVPNTALAKDADKPRWEQGLIYLIDYAGLYVLAIPVLIGFLGASLHLTYALRWHSAARAAVVAAPVVAAVMHVLYIVRVGGDFMHARFLLPDTMALMLPAAVLGVERVRRETATVVAAFVAGWSVAIATSARPPYQAMPNEYGIANERAFWVNVNRDFGAFSRHDWVPGGARGRAAGNDAAAGWSYYDNGTDRYPTPDGTGVYVATDNLGILSVAAGTNVSVIDNLALADAVTAHSTMDPRLYDISRVGHRERPEAWRLARYAAPTANDSANVQHARAALRCGDLAVLQKAINGPLDRDKFWKNVRLAPRLTFFTFPAEPAEARKQLCNWDPQGDTTGN